jgi:hypothetical protein
LGVRLTAPSGAKKIYTFTKTQKREDQCPPRAIEPMMMKKTS